MGGKCTSPVQSPIPGGGVCGEVKEKGDMEKKGKTTERKTVTVIANDSSSFWVEGGAYV